MAELSLEQLRNMQEAQDEEVLVEMEVAGGFAVVLKREEKYKLCLYRRYSAGNWSLWDDVPFADSDNFIPAIVEKFLSHGRLRLPYA